MEDSKKSTSSRSKASSGSHMDIKFINGADKKDVNRAFCMKQNTGTQMRYWPKGRFLKGSLASTILLSRGEGGRGGGL